MVNAENPFFKPFDNERQTPPFAEIKTEHFEPAILRGVELANKDIESIVTNPDAPTFENTIVALDNAGEDLNRVLNVFYPLTSALCDDEMMEVINRVQPVLSNYSTSVILNEGLWNRVKTVYENRASLKLTPEQQTLLENTYNDFALSGATLTGDDRDTFRQLNDSIGKLTNRFGQNVLKELKTYEIWLTADDLDGLPKSAVEAASLAASQKGREGEYLFTLDQPVYTQFMKYSTRRDLREKMYRLYMGRNREGEYNNKEIIKQIADLRRQRANLLGSQTYAQQSLKRTMAQTPENVMGLLNQLAEAYRPAADAELTELNKFATEIEGTEFQVAPWDYSFYSTKLKNAKYSYDEEEMRPYFQLDNVIDGVFGLATRLYGLQFTENKNIPVYHPDVKAFDVNDADGSYIGVIFTDFFPRDTKRAGAWMTEFRGQHVKDGEDVRPHVTIVMNFTKPTADEPSLLTPYEVETFLHEFGHALHGLLSQCNYQSLAGTNVYRDFVELPSQFNENYLTEKEFLDGFARHYKTGEPIPQELIDKLVASSQYGAAYACLRQLMFGLIDMKWHSITEPVEGDSEQFENEAYASVALFTPIPGTMTSTTFSHIFSGGYAAGYYSYKWAEVLDADAFAKFKEDGIFNQETAKSFRQNILERGGTENPALLYRRFRGADPSINALLKRDGINPINAKQINKDM
ncbi:MAG: M3 family metallopeptidase [Muribaculaceae bacterium]|nr:M3 family metallopeptidase [Muribaculaceae bacterium]